MTRQDMLDRIVALRTAIREDWGQTWEENFVQTMLDVCVDRLEGRASIHDKALDLSLVGERFKTWLDMGWSMKEDYADWRFAAMHKALNDVTEAAWQVHCRREENENAD